MKFLKFILIFAFVCLPFIGFTQVAIDKSKDETVRIEGKLYYNHLVVHGETLYNLCRTYGVSTEELLACNPQLAQGLKSGQRLKIPQKGDATIAAKTDAKTEAPQKREIEKTSTTSNDQEYESLRKHKIKKKDTLKSISEKYDCTIDDLFKYNPQLYSGGLKKGQYVTIPPQAEFENHIAQPTTEPEINSEPTISEPAVEKTDIYKYVNCDDYRYSGEKLNVTLLLPIKAANINYMEKSADYRFLEFYEGALLALDSLSRSGISVNISTLDVFDNKSLNTALESDALANSDLIIGPVYKTAMDTVAKFAAERSIPIVSPLDAQTENIAYINPFFVQAPTTNDYQTERLDSLLCTEKEKVFIIYEKYSDSTQYNNLQARLASCDKKAQLYQYILLKSHNEQLSEMLDKKEKNHVVVLSNNQVFVTDVLSKLNALAQTNKLKITVYGSSLWKTSFSDLNLEHFYNLNTILVQRFYVDYNREDVKNFVHKYRFYYKGDPSNFSFAGYDISLYFISKLAKYGRGFVHCIYREKQTETYLQSRFKFVKASDLGGLLNSASFVLHHTPDMQIVVE